MNKFNGILIKNFNLKNISSFKIGGKAKYYYIPDNLNDLKNLLVYLKYNKKKYFLVGNASNILFNDKFYNGYILNLKGFTNYIINKGEQIICGASILLNNLIDYCIKNSLKGLENLSGIPGTVGGALIMNAGAFDQEIGNVVESVKVLSLTGQIKILSSNNIKFTYRNAYPLNKYIVLETTLKLKKGDFNSLTTIKNKILKLRTLKQPLEFPSCGSIFKRPKNNFAGTLIEQSNLKGYKIGDAKISEKHANFIINMGHAKSKDVINLIKYIQRIVLNNYKIHLEPEIKLFNFNN